MKIFQNYHRHSFYTNIKVPDSTTYNEDYAKRAVELGHGIISSVEHGTQGRYIEAYEYAQKYNLKFLFGTEAYWVKDRLEKDRTNAHIILLAKNENGRQSINDILSEANISGYYYQPRIDLGLILSLPKDDVWVTSACIAFWKYGRETEEFILKLKKHFGKNFFLELQNHNTEQQIILNKEILNLSQQYSISTIMGCDSHFILNETAWERDEYIKSKGIFYDDEIGWYMDYPDGETAYNRFLKQGILTKKQIEEAIDNTNILLEVKEYNNPIFNKEIKMPTLYENLSQEEKNIIYENLIWENWNKEKIKIPIEQHKLYEDEIHKEVEIVKITNHADYFLCDNKMIKRGIEKGGLITDTGRGSAVSFFTNKLLGITKVDRIASPVKMYPERFMSATRILESKSLADLDLNLANPLIFAEAQREIFGEEHTFPMIAYGTLKAKSAWKMNAKAKDIEFDLANEVSEQIEKYENALKHAKEDEVDEINVYDYVDEKYHAILKESESYLGIVSDFKIHPCFDKNTLIMTSKGYKNISEIQAGECVLTHKNKFEKVLATMNKQCDKLYKIKTNGEDILVTGNHPFYVRTKISGYEYDNHNNRVWIKKYDSPCWKVVEEITKEDRIGVAINQESIIPIFIKDKYKKIPLHDKDFWWFVGRYIGDGWNYNPKKYDYRIFISCSKNNNEKDEILNKIPRIYKPRVVEERTSFKITFNNKLLYEYLEQFGKYAYNKKLTSDIFNLPIVLLQSFLDGYLSADGHFNKDEKTIHYTTVSKELAYGLQSCIHKVYKMPCTISLLEAGTDIIEERVCNRRKQYIGRFKLHEDKKDRNFYDSGYIWTYFKGKELIKYDGLVYNLEVENDNSYTVNNLIAHNCAYLIYQGNIRRDIGLIKTKSGKKEFLCTIMDGKWAEDYKFLKNDLLKVSVVDVIKRVYQRIGIEPHDVNELIEISKGNEKLWNIYAKGYTLGINQVEQNGTKHRMMQYKAKNISELCAFVAAIRPGFKSMYKIFANREKFDYGIPTFDNLIQTEDMPNSFMLYQEMAMTALNFAGVPMSECYEVIKNIAKKRAEKVLKYKEIFLEGFAKVLIETENKNRQEAQEISEKVWQIISDSVRYSFNASHSFCVAMDSLYGAYLKSHYPLQFYEVFLNILDTKGSQKDRISATIIEAREAFKIKTLPFKFGQDNRKFTLDEKNNTISRTLKSVKGFGDSVAEELYNIRNNKYNNFVDLLIDLEENTGLGNAKIETLIKLNYFSDFGRNQKLLNLFEEFRNGKNRYDKKHTEKTKMKRIEVLYEFESSLEDIALPIHEQIAYENELLGTPTSTYEMPKGTSFIMNLDLKNSPKANVYGLSTGTVAEVKIYKKDFKKLPFKQGDIVQFLKLKKKQKVKYVGEDLKGKPIFEPIDGEFDIWCFDENDKNKICYKIVNMR